MEQHDAAATTHSPANKSAGAMQPPYAVRFSDNSNARLWLEVELIVALPRYFFSLSVRGQRVVRYSRKLRLDFGVIHRICKAMDEQELRGLFTEIGCIMEDASVTALVWMHDDTRSILARASELRNAYDKIGLLLKSIEENVR